MATKISFRLMHPTLDLAVIAKAIGLPIVRIWAAGKDRRTPKGDPLNGVYQESYCSFSVVTAEGTVPAAIRAVDIALHGIVGSQVILQSKELEKSLYCTLMREGETIDCNSLGRLVEWGIRLEIEGCNMGEAKLGHEHEHWGRGDKSSAV